MQLLKKRETAVQNIAYIAIMSAINVIFVLISNFLPILFLLLVFILPLTSVIVTIYCKKRYLPVYFLTTIGLCLAITFGMSIFDTFIYVIPSLITGSLFGIMIEKRVPTLYILIGNTIVQFLLTYLTFIFFDLVVQHVSFFESIYKMIGLADYQYKAVLTHIFVYLISQIQIVITYTIVKYEVKRLDIPLNLDLKYRFTLYIATGVMFILAILAYFFFPNFCLLFTLIALPIAVYEAIGILYLRNKWVYISLGSSIIITIFLFAFLYPFVIAPNHLFLVFIFFALVTIIDFIFNYCLKQKDEKIK